MRMHFQIVSLIIITVISLPLSLCGENLVKLLVEEAEYELARIELYKTYKNASEAQKQKTLGKIAYTYQLGGNHRTAKERYLKAVQFVGVNNQEYADSIKWNLCYSLLKLDEFGEAYGLIQSIHTLDTTPLVKQLGVYTAEYRKIQGSVKYSAEEQYLLKKLRADLRNPTLSKILSLFIPGAGQMYSSHPIDGLQALLVVGAGSMFSLVAINSYHAGDLHLAVPIATTSITALFHYANVLSGHRAAIYRNMKLKRDFLSKHDFGFQLLNMIE